MAIKLPLVLGPNGLPQQLQAGDALSSGGLGGSATLTLPSDCWEWEQVITAVGVVPAHRVMVTLQAGADSDENTSDMLDLISLAGVPGTDQITVKAAFSLLTVGPVLINWSAF